MNDILLKQQETNFQEIILSNVKLVNNRKGSDSFLEDNVVFNKKVIFNNSLISEDFIFRNIIFLDGFEFNGKAENALQINNLKCESAFKIFLDNTTNNPTNYLTITSSEFDNIQIDVSGSKAMNSIQFSNNKIVEKCYMRFSPEIDAIRIVSNDLMIEDQTLLNDLPKNRQGYRVLTSRGKMKIDVSYAAKVEFSDNKTLELTYTNKEFDPIVFSGTYGNVSLQWNVLSVPFLFEEMVVESVLEIKNNLLTGEKALGFNKFIFPELYLYLDWKQFNKNKIFVLLDQKETSNMNWGRELNGRIVFTGDERITEDGDRFYEIQHEEGYKLLVSYHSKIYQFYRGDANIQDANLVYNEMQELNTSRFAYLYDINGGLNNFFKLQINNLLKAYTDYGTDPAKALVISFYIILAFAFVYIFYPSDWDEKGTQDLVNTFKAIFKKDSSNRFRWVFLSAKQALKTVTNSFTLSLNAFVTLGFGNIPTTGTARYLCILEGFIGWFLLSLFSVALINQVLF